MCVGAVTHNHHTHGKLEHRPLGREVALQNDDVAHRCRVGLRERGGVHLVTQVPFVLAECRLTTAVCVLVFTTAVCLS
eukprot:COSAG01_NODE_6626_length_3571_cov_5.948445_2_plen_78_part_00